MKKLRITAAMAITALLLAGCDNEEQKVVPDPIINVDTETVIELPPAGGSASFVYSIDNPVENGRLEAEPSDTWMSDFTTTDDEVRFRVEANETEELREGTVSLTYVYGEDKTVNAVVNVSQAVMQSGEEPVPTITITTEEPLALAGTEAPTPLSTKSQIPPRMEAYPRTQETPVGLQTLTAIQMVS